jgi:hypothetical protein
MRRGFEAGLVVVGSAGYYAAFVFLFISTNRM